MAFSEEIKIEALRNSRMRFGEISIQYSSRLGEIKLNPWRDGFQNLVVPGEKALLPMNGSTAITARRAGVERPRAAGAAAGTLARRRIPIAEMLVVDNGSTDGAPKLPSARGARVIAHGTRMPASPRGEPRASREHAREWLAILNSDVELAPDWLANCGCGAGAPAWFATGKILTRAGRELASTARSTAVPRRHAPGASGSGRPTAPNFRSRAQIWLAPVDRRPVSRGSVPQSGLLDEVSNPISKMSISGCAARARTCRAATFPRRSPGIAAARRLGAGIPKRCGASRAIRCLWSPDITPTRACSAIRLADPGGADTMGLVRSGMARLAWLRGKAQGLRRFRRHVGKRRFDTGAARAHSADSERDDPATPTSTGFDLYWRAVFPADRGGAK